MKLYVYRMSTMGKIKQAPSLWHLENLMKVVNNSPDQREIKPGVWVPGRSVGLDTVKNRFKLAWGVFTGKFDALKWPGQ